MPANGRSHVERDVPVLLAGGGLIGLSTAMFLAQHGIASLVVERLRGGSPVPRAAHFHLRTLELFRSAGIEDEVKRQSEKEFLPEGAIVAVDSLAGRKLADIIPSLNVGVDDALSPCRRLLVTQPGLEPILRKRARQAGAEVLEGSEIVAIGHSSGAPTPATSVGVVKSLYKLDEGKIIRSTARFALGASGSGLFDEEGRLVGINTFKTTGPVAYYYAVPVEWLAVLEKLPVETHFPIVGTAFWEEDEDTKPFFLQVAVPELREDWPKLAQVAEHWVKAQPENSEAWYEFGSAQEHMGKQAEAEQAYRKSIALDAANTDALFRIGIIASKKGDTAEVHAVNLGLADLDKDIAREFSQTVGCDGQC